MNIKFGKLNEYKPIKFINNKYVISWGLEKVNDDSYKWKYFVSNNKISKNEIKDIINAYVNSEVKKSIENKFEWNSMHIYLSLENQIDYKLLFDVTMLQNGKNLPETIKFKVNGENIFYEIESIEEFKDFIIKMNNHIRTCIKIGNNIKESINYVDYQI